MKALKQQWTNLFSQESEDEFISGLNNSINLNKDLFDISSEVWFANRFPSFNEQKSLKGLTFIDPQLEIENKLGALNKSPIANSKLIINDITGQRTNENTDKEQTNEVKNMDSDAINEEVKIPSSNSLKAKPNSNIKSNIQKMIGGLVGKKLIYLRPSK